MSLAILENIINDFDLNQFRRFFASKNRTFQPSDDSLTYFIGDKEQDLFEKGEKLGQLELPDGDLLVAAFAVKKELTERSGKKAQYELGKRILRDTNFQRFNAGIFIFYDSSKSFRFSLIYYLPQKTRKQWSAFKRYTYYVNKEKPRRTFLKNIGECSFQSIEEIIDAFSTLPLTKEFYTEIQNWYAWALKEAWFPGGKIEENLIRLLTRLIFVWFLKEKRLIPEEIFNKEFLQKIVKDFGKNDYYYNTILQNLFFATLNRKPESRRFATHGNFPENRQDYNVNNVYRYKDKILISEKQFINIFKKTPFINGGLFECLDDKDRKILIDGFSREEAQRAKLPDYLFFSQERDEDLSHFYGTRKTKKVRGLINILKDYNFTADENSPIDVEVSLDPELLGHIFENLLAAYNPETQTTARKATGSYYTPKEVVEFMVDKSLFYYFKTKVGLKDEKLRRLLSYDEEELDFDKEKIEKIIKAIDELKIIDPAVGSGAFPMGILHKLVHILGKIDPTNDLWKEKQYQRALKEIEDILKIENKKEREKQLKEVNENFDDSINYPDYARKLYLIENSIYGVDVQPIAIQICKLRFFLSLLIDQKRKIKPLPHLETKFVSANTLIGLNKQPDKPTLELNGKKLLEDSEITHLKNELKQLYKKHFSIKNRQEKLRLKKKSEKIRKKLQALLEKRGWATEEAEKIAEFDIFDQTASANWFDSEWMLGVDDGFDIVIGNPPYISTKGIDKEFKTVLEQHYGFVDDSYNHFYFKGIELLKEKGILTYISSNTFWTIQTKRNLRELLLNNKIIFIFDTANPFESSMVDTCVITVQKEGVGEEHIITFLDGKNDLKNPEKYIVKQKVFKEAPNLVFFMPTSYNMQIYKKLGRKVKELLDKWWGKISTSKNIEKYKGELEEYRKSLKPGDITLLGLITEGGQGLATGNNGKYIGVLEGTKWAEKVKKERPEKLWRFIQNKRPKELSHLKSKQEVKAFLDSLSEKEIRRLFDTLKEKYGRDIFGQGWLYRIVSKDEIADVDKLTEDEKLNGIEGERTFVPYDKGDKEGNRWYAPTPYYIDWNREKVKILQKDPKARWQGYQFYFREGFCWTNVLNPSARLIKARLKQKSVNDVGAMSLYTLSNLIPNYYLVCLLNSTLLFNFYRTFINYSVNIQINDIRQLPIIISTQQQLKEFKVIFDRAYNIQKRKFAGEITEEEAEKQLEEVQKELDEKVEKMYLG